MTSALTSAIRTGARYSFRGAMTGAAMFGWVNPAKGEEQRSLLDLLFARKDAPLSETTRQSFAATPLPGKGKVKFDAGLRPIPATVHGNILLRYFKAEGELEIWESNSQGVFSKRTTFAITKLGSRGKLGPKQREGDLTTPEGIWHVTRAHMAPTASFAYPVKIPYPNALETFQGKTGSEILFHNDIGMIADPQSTASCVALENKEAPRFRGIIEAAFRRGQTSIQVQGFPFRMTDSNITKYSRVPAYKQHMAGLWAQMKPVYDAFETTRTQPSVSYCTSGYKLNQNVTDSDICTPATVQNTNALKLAASSGPAKRTKSPLPEAAPLPPARDAFVVTAKQIPVVTAPVTPAPFTVVPTAKPDQFDAARFGEFVQTPVQPVEKPMRLGPPGPDEIVIPVEIIIETSPRAVPKTSMNGEPGVTVIAKNSCNGRPLAPGAYCGPR